MFLKQLFGVAVIVCFCIGQAVAGDAKADAKDALTKARALLLDVIEKKVEAAKAKPDLAKYSIPIDKFAATDAEFKKTWDAFKETRDTKIVPAFEKGDAEMQAEAKKLATTIQKERFIKMMEKLK